MSDEVKREVLARLGGPDLNAGRIEFADGFYRYRRRRLVRIPDEWVGTPALLCGDGFWRAWLWSRRPRNSKAVRKRRMKRHGDGCSCCGRVPRDRWERAKQRGERRRKHDPGHPKTFAPRHAGRRHQRRLYGMEE